MAWHHFNFRGATGSLYRFEIYRRGIASMNKERRERIELRIGDVLPEETAGRIVGNATFEYIGGDSTLSLLFDDVTDREIVAVQNGVLHFGAVRYKSVIFFIYLAGFDAPGGAVEAIVDGDCPFNIHLVPPEARSVPPPSNENAMAHLQIMLVERRDRVIKAIRNVLLAGSFTNYLHGMIRDQFNVPFDKETHVAEVDEGHDKYPTTWSFFAASEIVSRIE